jgi:hypothetical protein
MEQLELDYHIPSFKSIGETLRILKTKHSLPSPFVVLSRHSCMVFLDSH